MKFKSLDELVAVKAAPKPVSEVSVKHEAKGNAETFTISMPRIDKMSKDEKVLVLAECGSFKFGQPTKVKLANGKEVEIKVKATIYINL